MKKQNIAQLSREAGLKPATVYARLRLGWTLAKALKEPPQKRGKNAGQGMEEFPKKRDQLDHHTGDTITIAAVTATAIVVILILAIMNH